MGGAVARLDGATWAFNGRWAASYGTEIATGEHGVEAGQTYFRAFSSNDAVLDPPCGIRRTLVGYREKLACHFGGEAEFVEGVRSFGHAAHVSGKGTFQAGERRAFGRYGGSFEQAAHTGYSR